MRMGRMICGKASAMPRSQRVKAVVLNTIARILLSQQCQTSVLLVNNSKRSPQVGGKPAKIIMHLEFVHLIVANVRKQNLPQVR